MRNSIFRSISYSSVIIRAMNITIFIALILGLSSCYKKIDSTLNIKVQSYNHEAIDKANIYLDNENIGETDDKGEFVITQKLSTKRHELMVKKFDDNLSFSTYKQYLKVSKDNKDLFIEVTLFSVPKGSFAKDSSQESKKESNEKIENENIDSVDISGNQLPDDTHHPGS